MMSLSLNLLGLRALNSSVMISWYLSIGLLILSGSSRKVFKTAVKPTTESLPGSQREKRALLWEETSPCLWPPNPKLFRTGTIISSFPTIRPLIGARAALSMLQTMISAPISLGESPITGRQLALSTRYGTSYLSASCPISFLSFGTPLSSFSPYPYPGVS